MTDHDGKETDMTDIIQRARDVLAKWRGHALHGNWSPVPLLSNNAVYTFDAVDESSAYAANSDDEVAMCLIIGTAGNPDLLDALDQLLESAELVEQDHRAGWAAVIWGKAEPIAAAIIAAEERMQS